MFLTSLRAAIARVFWRLSPWKLVREAVPVDGPRLLIGAPHTSNFDFVLMLGIAWDARMRIHWLGKRELFKGIAGPIMRGLGGIAVDRTNAAGVVDAVVAKARTTDRFLLVVTPEGTRQGNGWRSGFYRIAMAAGLPVTLGYADGATKTAGLGETLQLTGGADGIACLAESAQHVVDVLNPTPVRRGCRDYAVVRVLDRDCPAALVLERNNLAV